MYSATDATFVEIEFARDNIDDRVLDSPLSRDANNTCLFSFSNEGLSINPYSTAFMIANTMKCTYPSKASMPVL
jgi:hypothetical protein